MKKAITTATATELHSSFNIQPAGTFRANNFYPVILSLSLSLSLSLGSASITYFYFSSSILSFSLKMFFFVEIMPKIEIVKISRKGASRNIKRVAFNIGNRLRAASFREAKTRPITCGTDVRREKFINFD